MSELSLIVKKGALLILGVGALIIAYKCAGWIYRTVLDTPPAPEAVMPAVGTDELSEEKLQNDGATREVGSDAAFNQIPRTAAEMEQPALGLVEPPASQETAYMIGDVMQYAIVTKKHIKGGQGAKKHVENLLAKLKEEGFISDKTPTAGVCTEIDAYYERKAKEPKAS